MRGGGEGGRRHEEGRKCGGIWKGRKSTGNKVMRLGNDRR
jgi:hypothetical protein